MIKVAILGAGNVATHLYQTFTEVENLEVIQVYNRNPAHLAFVNEPEKRISQIKDLKKADLYVLALTDEVIETFANQLPKLEGLVTHTSGSASMNILKKFTNYGVFYPLQTFSKEKELNFKEIPICIEASSGKNLMLLKKTASALSNRVYEIDSQQRKSLHLAAVFVNNFSNHLFALSAAYCEKQKVPFEILKPLITETINKLDKLSPLQAQTGPAKRNDSKTIQAHKEMLDDNGKKIYTILTESIQKLHGKKL